MSIFRTPSSRSSVAPSGKTLKFADSAGNGDDDDRDDDDRENRCPNKSPPNLEERKRAQKRTREDGDEDKDSPVSAGSPCKRLEPRQLVYPEEDALGTIASMGEDDQEEEEEPRTQSQTGPQGAADEGLEEGECTPESQLAIAG